MEIEQARLLTAPVLKNVSNTFYKIGFRNYIRLWHTSTPHQTQTD